MFVEKLGIEKKKETMVSSAFSVETYLGKRWSRCTHRECLFSAEM